MTRRTSQANGRPPRTRGTERLTMKLSLMTAISSALAVASGAWLDSSQDNRESKWDVIHHEYHGPPAPLAKDGRVVDTPEVTEARANHLAIHAETIAELAKIMSKAESEGQPEAQPQAPLTVPAEIMAMILGHAQLAEAEVKENKEEAKEEEVKPIVEQPEINNAIDIGHPEVSLQASYEGPLAPIGEDGRVLDTPEVRKAKEAHLSAYKEVAELATREDEPWESRIGGEKGAAEETRSEAKKPEARAWYEQPWRRAHVPAVQLLYQQDGPVGYRGPAAPLGEDGRVVDTAEVERAKTAHWRAYQHAQEIAKRHPPRTKDNSV